MSRVWCAAGSGFGSGSPTGRRVRSTWISLQGLPAGLIDDAGCDQHGQLTDTLKLDGGCLAVRTGSSSCPYVTAVATGLLRDPDVLASTTSRIALVTAGQPGFVVDQQYLSVWDESSSEVTARSSAIRQANQRSGSFCCRRASRTGLSQPPTQEGLGHRRIALLDPAPPLVLPPPPEPPPSLSSLSCTRRRPPARPRTDVPRIARVMNQIARSRMSLRALACANNRPESGDLASARPRLEEPQVPPAPTPSRPREPRRFFLYGR